MAPGHVMNYCGKFPGPFLRAALGLPYHRLLCAYRFRGGCANAAGRSLRTTPTTTSRGRLTVTVSRSPRPTVTRACAVYVSKTRRKRRANMRSSERSPSLGLGSRIEGSLLCCVPCCADQIDLPMYFRQGGSCLLLWHFERMGEVPLWTDSWLSRYFRTCSSGKRWPYG